MLNHWDPSSAGAPDAPTAEKKLGNEDDEEGEEAVGAPGPGEGGIVGMERGPPFSMASDAPWRTGSRENAPSIPLGTAPRGVLGGKTEGLSRKKSHPLLKPGTAGASWLGWVLLFSPFWNAACGFLPQGQVLGVAPELSPKSPRGVPGRVPAERQRRGPGGMRELRELREKLEF